MVEQLLSIQSPGQKPPAFAVFNLGFRPFFLLTGLFSFISILVWGGIYVYGWAPPTLTYSSLQWHAHEMIFGYALAVVAGFLLTAVRNWTNIQTLNGKGLAALSLLWLAARAVGLMMPAQVHLMFVLDGLFGFFLCIAIAYPIVQAKQKQQIGIVSKVVLLLLANILFYLGALGVLEQGIAWGLYSGLYLIVSLMFVMARRVLPLFIERGVGDGIKIKNRTWVDRSSLVLFLLFWVTEVFWRNVPAASLLAALLFVVHAIRLYDWHTPGLWRKPLLWVLYIGYSCAVFGFLLHALTPVLGLSPYLAVHAFAVGGVGIMTVGMMARVALGHTGRNIHEAPNIVTVVFLLLILSFVARVLLPLFTSINYLLCVGLSHALWLAAFALFVFVYAPILIKPRVDGMPG